MNKIINVKNVKFIGTQTYQTNLILSFSFSLFH